MRRLYFALSIKLRAYVRGHPKLAYTFLAIIVAAGGAGASGFLASTYETEPSEWRAITLEDGSIARLGPRTSIDVRYSKKQRLIQQLNGEVTYQVAHEHRAFKVQCGIMTVLAVGTKFEVNCDPQASFVTVAEGTVSVFRGLEESDQEGSIDHMRVNAGHRVQVDPWMPLVPKTIDIDVALAWERQRVFFNNTPIEQAIGEFNRRNQQQIPIPINASETVIGEFDLSDPNKFAEHLLRTSPTLPSN